MKLRLAFILHEDNGQEQSSYQEEAIVPKLPEALDVGPMVQSAVLGSEFEQLALLLERLVCFRTCNIGDFHLSLLLYFLVVICQEYDYVEWEHQYEESAKDRQEVRGDFVDGVLGVVA